jgi:hypothetical protein
MKRGLVKKQIVDKTGKRTTVWVKPNKKDGKKGSKKTSLTNVEKKRASITLWEHLSYPTSDDDNEDEANHEYARALKELGLTSDKASEAKKHAKTWTDFNRKIKSVIGLNEQKTERVHDGWMKEKKEREESKKNSVQRQSAAGKNARKIVSQLGEPPQGVSMIVEGGGHWEENPSLTIKFDGRSVEAVDYVTKIIQSHSDFGMFTIKKARLLPVRNTKK